MLKTTQENLDLWLNAQIDPQTRSQLDRMILESPDELNDAFYQKLAFGTGGMRGVMGIGTNRLNTYTIGMATQGLANYLLQENREHSVFIGYDCRHNSRLFAEEAARVLAGNGIRVYLTKELRPTPYVSFGCRLFHCSAGIMITASHNPPEYNGYKVYGSDGGQIVSPQDKEIIEQVDAISSLDKIKKTDSINHPLIEEVLEQVDHAYLTAIAKQQFYPEVNRSKGQTLHIVYSNLHGTGITLIPRALDSWGFPQLSLVEEQNEPDGNFPTVDLPNPEEENALKMGLEKLERLKADLLIATDPDADRVAVAVRHQGRSERIDGNQMACILLNHICAALPQMPENTAFVKTIGTTELFRAIAESHGGACIDVLTGFKYIAEKIAKWEKDPNGLHFIFGGEESCGYLLGTHARDKDAIISSALIAEAALQAKLEGKTLVDRLHDIWKTYGMYADTQRALGFPETKEGHDKIEKGITRLRTDPPQMINGMAVSVIEDYFTSTKTCLSSGKKEQLTLPKSAVLRLFMEDGSKLMIRPSGTEPKIKFYCGVFQKEFASVAEAWDNLKLKSESYLNALQNLFNDE
jgi:phosphomannomutase